MTTYYVSTTGSDSANGNSDSPWRTISHAMDSPLQPGDEVVVRPGMYFEKYGVAMKAGSADGYITLRSGDFLERPRFGRMRSPRSIRQTTPSSTASTSIAASMMVGTASSETAFTTSRC